MKRRSVLDIFLKSVIGLPLISSVTPLLSREIRNSQNELFPDPYEKPTAGLGFGVPRLDKMVNGVDKGELAIVYSPLDNVTIGLLVNAALFNVINQSKKVDYIVSQSDEAPYVGRALHRVPEDERRRMLHLIYSPSPDTSLLRIKPVELGLPSVRWWKLYRDSVKDDPPDIIILDGVELIELFLEEDNMAAGLKKLAVDLSVPVIVNVPVNRGIYNDDDIVHPREDFNKIADIHVGLKPLAVSKYKERDRSLGKYIFLETNILVTDNHLNRPFYTVMIGLDYNEWYCEFG